MKNTNLGLDVIKWTCWTSVFLNTPVVNCFNILGTLENYINILGTLEAKTGLNVGKIDNKRYLWHYGISRHQSWELLH